MFGQLSRFIIVFALMLLAASCGKPEDKNLCSDVSCAGGVCDPDSGICENPSVCTESATCLEGYECAQEQCVAEFSCADDGSCDRGECVDGACVNPARCDASTDCVPGYACEGDACIEDKCDLSDCTSGVCDQSTGECVNSAVCTAATQAEDCLDGFICYDQKCADEAAVCADLECDRGQCSFVDVACLNPEDCEGSDMNCLAGFFCNAVDQCQQNVCDGNGVTCSRGVCEAATGACVNADNCANNTECTDGFYCVEGACTDMDAACDVCSGNQLCNYDEGASAIVCQENPRGCRTTLDCVAGRECASGSCGTPVACVADGLEPNNSQGAATDWFAQSGAVFGSICSGDSDYFRFDVADDPEFTGTLISLLTIDATDIGVGVLDVELLNAAGAVVASTTSQLSDGQIRLEYVIGNTNQGVYTLAIKDSSVSAGGINYELFMDLVETRTVQLCQSAGTLTGTVSGDTSVSTSNALGSSCLTDRAATEQAWDLEIVETSYVTISLQGTTFDGSLSLRTQCEADASELACANSTAAGMGETLSARLEPGTYSVIVQGAAANQAGVYALTVTAEPVICSSDDNTCNDASSANVCNGRGTGFDTQTCDNGCDDTIGSCVRELADVCTTAIDATSGYSGTLNFTNLSADYDPGTACVSVGTDNVTQGPDAVFSVSLQPGDVLYALAAPIAYNDVGIYVMDDCSNPTNSCILGVNNANFDGDEEFVYLNDTAIAQDLYLVLDSETGSTGDVQMDILVGPAVCVPGTLVCNGSNEDTCNVAGTGYDTRACTYGCNVGSGACNLPPNDTCGAGAIDISAGGTFTGDLADYSADYNGTSGCTGGSSSGRDAAYVLTGTPGDVVSVSLNATFDSTLYAVGDCTAPSATCFDGSDSGNPEEIQFVIRDTNPIYVVVDAWSSSGMGTYTLTVAVQTPDCFTYGEAVTCQPDGTTLQFCNGTGFFEDYACASTCTAGACDAPTGDQCFDAIPATVGTQMTGNFTNFTDATNPGIGTCIQNTSNEQDGRDVVYAVDLIAGDLLTANITSGSTGTGMYILEGCDARAECVWAQPAQDELQFFASKSQTYYLVLDSIYSGGISNYTLDLDVQPGFVCQPGGATCDNSTDTLTVCNIDGTQISNTVTCQNGCGASDACAAPTAVNDTCATAAVITGSTRFVDSYARFTDTLDPGATSGNSCAISSFNSDGPEAIYQVTLGAGTVLDVTVDDLGGLGSPTVYITRDCADPETTCVAEETASVARTGYVSQLGETVFLVVDNSTATASDPFVVDINIRPSQCAPTLMACTDADTREWCDQYGVIQYEDCYFGCATGACNPPTNDTCSAPIDVSAGGTYNIAWSGYNSDYGASTVSCAGTSARGPDAVFSVTGLAGDILEVSMNGSSTDAVLWLTTACGTAASCLVGTDDSFTGQAETLTYRLPADGTYFIMADSFSTTTSGSFTLDVNLSPPICTPGVPGCDTGGQNVEVCNALGTGYEVFSCDTAGCVLATTTCATSTGEYPAAAFDANALGQFMGTYAGFVDDFNLNSSTSCTGWYSPGPDIAYFVDLTQGETITATLTGTDDTSLYIMDAMNDPDSNCLVGEDNTSGTETVTYTATATGRVWIIVDAFSSSASGMYTLDLGVQ